MIKTIGELFQFAREKDEILERLDHILGLFPNTYWVSIITDFDCYTATNGDFCISVNYDETIRGCTDSNTATLPAAWFFMSDEEIRKAKAEMDAEKKRLEEERKRAEAEKRAIAEREQELKTLARLKAKYEGSEAGA